MILPAFSQNPQSTYLTEPSVPFSFTISAKTVVITVSQSAHLFHFTKWFLPVRLELAIVLPLVSEREDTNILLKAAQFVLLAE